MPEIGLWRTAKGAECAQWRIGVRLFGRNLQKSELHSCVIEKKFLPLQSPNERGLSSVGLERLLDRQEVGSSNLPVLTTRKRHLQRCRCLFFFIRTRTPNFAKLPHESPRFMCPQQCLRCARGRNRPVAHRKHPRSAQNGFLGAAIWRRGWQGRGSESGKGWCRAGRLRYHRISTRTPSGLLGKRRKRVREAESQEKSEAGWPSTSTLRGSRRRRMRVTLKVSAGALHT